MYLASGATGKYTDNREDFSLAVARQEGLLMAPTHYTTGGRSVVIVDDDADNALVLEMLFNAETGFQTLVYRDGLQALENLDIIRESCPALFLIDQRLPHMDGLALCEQLRSRDEFKALPFILVTSFVNDVLIKEAGKQGIPLVQKPYDIGMFLDMVQQYTQ